MSYLALAVETNCAPSDFSLEISDEEPVQQLTLQASKGMTSSTFHIPRQVFSRCGKLNVNR